MKRRIGIFGGTFDPPHVGHTVIAKQAMEQHDLNRVYFVVAKGPWQKNPGTKFPDRMHMVRLALEKHRSWATPENLEAFLPGKSYTIDTLREFRVTIPNDDFFLIVGSDVDLSTWKESDEIPKLCTVSRQYRWLNLSSSTIRERIANDLPVTDLIDDKVYDYILDQNLYQEQLNG